MFTFFMIKMKFLSVGKTTMPNEEYQDWNIPITVKANVFWMILISKIEGIKAHITYINKRSGKQINRIAVWLSKDNSEDCDLKIGSDEKLGFVKYIDGKIYSVGKAIELTSDYDINLELKYGLFSLGKYLFENVITNGLIQEVNPIKMRNK